MDNKETIQYEVIRSSRKTVAIQIKPDGRVVVRAPKRVSMAYIKSFVNSKFDWIIKHREKMLSANEDNPYADLTEDELDWLVKEAKRVIPERVAMYAGLVGVTYGRITIRKQKSRWGSCSSKGNLNFNCLLMLTPLEVIDSIVVHELCHRLEMNHSRKFYEHVYRVYPDYDRWDRWLKENGRKLLNNF
ncbi:MAG: M48 family metallopeptidase [Lachnospiraceae bacterium]|nr:M48 family metallopeptidase [Lachnospiraceae bacterium]